MQVREVDATEERCPVLSILEHLSSVWNSQMTYNIVDCADDPRMHVLKITPSRLSIWKGHIC